MMSWQALIDFPRYPTQARPERQQAAFVNPIKWIVAMHLDEVTEALNQAHAAAQAGAWCVGYVRYEAAPAFDAAFQVHPCLEPLVCFAVFETAHDWPETWPDLAHHTASTWVNPISSVEFEQQVEQIHHLIRQGEVYQINYTALLAAEFKGDALAYFQALRRHQPNGYNVYLATSATVVPGIGSSQQILSVSPELFFDWHQNSLVTQPMKGTIARGTDELTDQQLAQQLLASEKERAENLMIVDLLRNDLSRLARPGTVRVPHLFELQALPTVWQMTSTITAEVSAGLKLADIFTALFPCGSITGAPKIRAMQYIKALERSPRGVYCGAIGVLQPGGRATFNVAIRTLTLDEHTRSQRAKCGIGSGITLDSTASGERYEWCSKQRFLERAAKPFQLLESLRLEDGRIWLLSLHLQRLQNSALALNFCFDWDTIEAELKSVAQAHAQGCFKLRLLLRPDGQVVVEVQPLLAWQGPLRISLATRPISSFTLYTQRRTDDFIQHKTTHRDVYDVCKLRPADSSDTLLWNMANELTELTMGNLALRLEDEWYTPDLSAGLLNGTYRRLLVKQGSLQEERLLLADLLRANAAAFLNSVRGWLPIDLIHLQHQLPLLSKSYSAG